MISKAIDYTVNSLNAFLQNKFALTEDIVIANKIVDQNGSVPVENENKVLLTLIHVDQETVKQFYNTNRKLSNNNFENKAQEERYNLYILISPNFENYNETLKFLNSSIQFFQTYSALDANFSSNIPKGINRLEFEFETGDGYQQMHNLWSALGAKYQPSVIYKMRLITIVSNEIKGFEAAVTTSNTIVQDE
ncbi:DUF4255 domain-containing protein [Tenacibaculum agarivorans]|uniref:DUF4255 domain-containing protein n=1 Tax=Tenacibaculum agarivorans TaxID=1908389 RepID=UPI00094B8540|nr:DUF4255 domain-containing protein [Tenacibaculum agarivorans]